MKRKYTKEVCMLLGILLALHLYPYYDFKGKVVMIDVGQGDCFLIKQPFHKGNILIDTGGLRNTDVAKNILVPYLNSEGIHKLDAVFISHDDFDHSGALESLDQLMDIKEIIRDFSEVKIGDVTFKNLRRHNHHEDINDNSLVIYACINGLSYLFTGDASIGIDDEILQDYPDLKVDVLKVSHHGSSTGTSDKLLQCIRPKVALISVGRNNSYGHPHRAVIERLEDYGVHIYRTDEMGMVKIIYYSKENYIYQ